MIDFYKAAGILIKDKKFLVVRQKNKDSYKSPGGKLEPGETSEKALLRELKEELCINISDSDLEKFGTFTARAAEDDARILQMEVYFVKNWQGEIKLNPDDNIGEFRWIDSSDLDKIKLGSIFANDVLPKLKALNLIN